ncbi:glyoxalase [Halobacteriales archaeon QH_6_64_20]|jgi:hypothetical protein|nr:MAG: glyoxalase [Halobacteriales archaeon QH_6_64_20]
MTGIVFFRSAAREEICTFYREFFDAETWLSQPDCTVLRYDSFLFGFCDVEGSEDTDVDRDGTITFVYDSRAAVDRAYERLGDRPRDEPTENEPYEIYNFFADDPEGRTIECQTFLHPIDPP